jgi:L-lactate dehydrogenase complex protein LldF
MTLFKEKIRENIGDNALQAALDGNAERRVKSRINAFASLPDWRERRQAAHAIRADVIANLDEYLDRFITKVQENGMQVHRAASGDEAVKIVLGIAHDRNARLVAKSKSMASEEINLNHALEAEGIRVVETDLGEYIVQLRGERPSHIITPAVHLRRHEVAQLFTEKLGIPYTEDIPTLTATARTLMREIFLNADIGLSGVNFGVAETGTLAIVTNEGNGRMVTTLPPVHIALMGMERLLPTLDDLALFLSLLPRSATGQKLSVYTQLIHGPEDPFSSFKSIRQEKHLIILDNGRGRLRASPLRESLYCIRCGACLNACPIFREIGGHAYLGTDGSIAPYPGPIGSVVSPGLFGLEEFGHLAQASTLCGACKDACPVDIDLPGMLSRIRAGQGSQQEAEGVGIPSAIKVGLRGFKWATIHPGLFAIGQRILGWLAIPFPSFIRIPAFTGWGYSKDFPRPVKPFRARWQEIKQKDFTDTGISTNNQSTPSDEQQVVTAHKPLIEQFIEELESVGGHAYQLQPNDLPARLVDFLKMRGIDRVQIWDEIPGLDPARLTEAGIREERNADPSIKAGITGALAIIADTGTLVIPCGASIPMTASLLPEIHVAVVRISQLLPSLPEAFRLPEIRKSPATVLVTGPSRTADIEMTLTIGVHGPKELHVFIVDDSGTG